ncbi:MAG: IS30 family transposase [Acidimicrobiia bacterium]|nr:IS30 family transposase [Acidimicrobiia bacterium]
MARLGRPGMSDERKRELWDRWKEGESISEISRAMGKPAGSVFTILRSNGGVVPAPRRRREGHLSVEEREEISRGLARGESLRAIARALRRPPSTVCREVNRNRGRSRYRAADAHDRAWYRARRPKPCLLARNPILGRFVADMLAEDWSPQQISGFLAEMTEPGSEMRVSHETIYKTLFIQSRGVLAKELTKHLRSRRPIRKNKHNVTTGQHRSQIKAAVSIRERPPEVEDRAVPGHWEGDLLLGRGVTQMATVVERASRFTVLVQLDGRDMATVAESLSAKMNELPVELRKSLTWDRGMELASHHDVTAWTGLDVYFADPRSPWQRGTNENTNRLLRQYFPKGVTMAGLTQDDLDTVALKLNSRPRKTLGYRTPATALEQLLR